LFRYLGFRLAPLLVFLAIPTVGTANTLRDSFETPDIKWKNPQSAGPFRIDRQEKSAAEVHSGLASEAIRVTAGDWPVYVSYPIAPANVIDELQAQIWVKANRPGVQLFARVVLPRSLDASGEPVATFVAGSVYTKVGAWQALELKQLPAQIQASLPALRVAHGPHVDAREAFVDRMLLNVSAGRGTTAVWLDDLQVEGIVAPETDARPSFRPVSTGDSLHASASRPAIERRVPQVRLSGPNILVGDSPMLVRAIVHRGEPLEYLKNLGFNAVKLSSPPSPEIAQAAERLNLWLLSPPPAEADTIDPDESAHPPGVLGRAYDRVLAWDLGSNVCQTDLENVKRRAQGVHVLDRELARPLFCEPLTDLRPYSRHAQILVLTRLPIGSSLELPKYLAWLRERPRLARLQGTPIWATIQTDPLPELEEQVRRLSAGRSAVGALQPEQIHLLAHTALAGGARGLIFDSRSRLDLPNAAARQRSQALHLLNLELSLAEPWVASGNFMMTLPGSDPEALAAVFESTQSRILLPLWSGRAAQLVPGQLAGSNISFVVPGVPEAFNAYDLTPADLPPPRHKRVAGGTRITLDEFGLSSIVLLTGDLTGLQHASRRVEAVSPQAARLKRDLAVGRLALVAEVDQRLVAQQHTTAKAAEYFNLARTNLADCDAQLAAGRFQTAYLAAERALRPLRLIERAHWEALTRDLEFPTISPFASSFSTLPEHSTFLAAMAATQFVRTELVGGDFEQLGLLEQTGWRHYRYPEPGIKTGAELSTQAPRMGRFSLRLWAQPIDPAQPPEIVETPPVWVETPGVQVSAGEVLRIRCWVRVSGISGSVDGLMIMDSIGGEALAERIEATADWKPITLYRAATQNGLFSVKFTLTGLGQAWIDEVTIERVMRPSDVIRPRPMLPAAGTPLTPRGPAGAALGIATPRL
jgi:hypothetical protein